MNILPKRQVRTVNGNYNKSSLWRPAAQTCALSLQDGYETTRRIRAIEEARCARVHPSVPFTPCASSLRKSFSSDVKKNFTLNGRSVTINRAAAVAAERVSESEGMKENILPSPRQRRRVVVVDEGAEIEQSPGGKRPPWKQSSRSRKARGWEAMSSKAVNAALPSQMEMQAAATKVAEGGLATEGTGGAAAESHLCQVPIAAVTADVMKGTKELCLQAGMSDYLPK